MDQLLKQYYKDIIKYTIIFLFMLFVIWIPIHEASHYSVCKLSENNPKLVLELPTSYVECVGIKDNSNIHKFIYFSIPYILVSALLLIIWYLYRETLSHRIFAYVLISDSFSNYFTSFFHKTDFTQILTHLGQNHLFLTLPFLVITTTVFFYLIKEDWKKFTDRLKEINNHR